MLANKKRSGGISLGIFFYKNMHARLMMRVRLNLRSQLNLLALVLAAHAPEGTEGEI